MQVKWLTLMLPILLFGCAAPKVHEPKVSAAAAAASALPVPRLQWPHPDPEGLTFEVWATSDLQTWELEAETTELYHPIQVDQPMRFYRVRARNAAGEVSDWNN